MILAKNKEKQLRCTQKPGGSSLAPYYEGILDTPSTKSLPSKHQLEKNQRDAVAVPGWCPCAPTSRRVDPLCDPGRVEHPATRSGWDPYYLEDRAPWLGYVVNNHGEFSSPTDRCGTPSTWSKWLIFGGLLTTYVRPGMILRVGWVFGWKGQSVRIHTHSYKIEGSNPILRGFDRCNPFLRTYLDS